MQKHSVGWASARQMFKVGYLSKCLDDTRSEKRFMEVILKADGI